MLLMAYFDFRCHFDSERSKDTLIQFDCTTVLSMRRSDLTFKVDSTNEIEVIMI